MHSLIFPLSFNQHHLFIWWKFISGLSKLIFSHRKFHWHLEREGNKSMGFIYDWGPSLCPNTIARQFALALLLTKKNCRWKLAFRSYEEKKCFYEPPMHIFYFWPMKIIFDQQSTDRESWWKTLSRTTYDLSLLSPFYP